MKPSIHEIVRTVKITFTGNTTAAARYCERVAAQNGEDAEQYTAAAQYFRHHEKRENESYLYC